MCGQTYIQTHTHETTTVTLTAHARRGLTSKYCKMGDFLNFFSDKYSSRKFFTDELQRMKLEFVKNLQIERSIRVHGTPHAGHHTLFLVSIRVRVHNEADKLPLYQALLCG